MAPTTRRAFLTAVGLAGLAGCGEHRRGGRSGAGDAAGSPGTTAAARRSDDATMIRIPGGEYTIGADSGPGDARPAHTVALAPFAIDRYEVTNAAFAALLNSLDVDPVEDAPPGAVEPTDLPPEARSRFIEGPEGSEDRPLVALDDGNARIGIVDGRFAVEDGYADHPVTEVTWAGARAFAAWRGDRLPTEAEWEAAARGTEGRIYPWGHTEPTPERAVYGRGSGETAPVGTHPAGATPRGVHDMAGNVSEWTSSLYRPYPYDADDGREAPDVRGERVTRGGAHVFFGPDQLRTYYRTGFSREFDRGHRHIGFRCARSVEG